MGTSRPEDVLRPARTADCTFQNYRFARIKHKQGAQGRASMSTVHENIFASVSHAVLGRRQAEAAVARHIHARCTRATILLKLRRAC
jgi:hypothetical protein